MYALFLALRYLRAQRIMAFAVAGVAIGIAVLIVVTSLMGGFMRDLKERIRGMQSHFTVVPDRDTGWGGASAGLVAGIRAVPHVTSAAPRLEYGAWMGIRGGRRPVRLVGIDPVVESKGELAPFFRAGGVDLLALKGDWAVPGGELPVEPGASCAFMTAREPDDTGASTMLLAVPREGLDFVSAGRFRSGLWESDSSTVFLPIDRMADYLRIPAGSYSLIAVSVDDFARSGDAVDRALIDVLLDRKLHGTVRPWTETQANFLQAVESEKAVQVVILFVIIGVAGFTILSLYMMMVQAKIRDLGVLRALGATGPGVAGIFIESGIACGAAGAVLGILLGVVVATTLDDFTVHVRTMTAGLAARGGARLELAFLAAGAAALVTSWKKIYATPSWAWKAAAAAAIVAAAQFHLQAGGSPWFSGFWLVASLSLLAAKRPSLSTLGHVGASLWVLLAGGIALSVAVADPKPGFEGFDLFPRQVYKLDRVPVMIDGTWIGLIVGVALVIGAVAALWPAFRAGLADPLEVIRDG